MLQKLDHPHILRALGFFRENGVLNIVMARRGLVCVLSSVWWFWRLLIPATAFGHCILQELASRGDLVEVASSFPGRELPEQHVASKASRGLPLLSRCSFAYLRHSCVTRSRPRFAGRTARDRRHAAGVGAAPVRPHVPARAQHLAPRRAARKLARRCERRLQGEPPRGLLQTGNPRAPGRFQMASRSPLAPPSPLDPALITAQA